MSFISHCGPYNRNTQIKNDILDVTYLDAPGVLFRLVNIDAICLTLLGSALCFFGDFWDVSESVERLWTFLVWYFLPFGGLVMSGTSILGHILCHSGSLMSLIFDKSGSVSHSYSPFTFPLKLSHLLPILFVFLNFHLVSLPKKCFW